MTILRHLPPKPTPESVVAGFIREMNGWEKRCAKSGDVDYKSLAVIFGRYCTDKDRIHAARRHYSQPPECDPAVQEIRKVEVAGRTARVFTKATPPIGKRVCFVLKKRPGMWRMVGVLALIEVLNVFLGPWSDRASGHQRRKCRRPVPRFPWSDRTGT